MNLYSDDKHTLTTDTDTLTRFTLLMLEASWCIIIKRHFR